MDDDQCKNLREVNTGDGHEYMDTWEIFQEKKLPPKNAFYSKLNMRGVSDQDYEHVQQVWNRVIYEFEDVSLGDYYDVYLATDVSLFADDFVNF